MALAFQEPELPVDNQLICFWNLARQFAELTYPWEAFVDSWVLRILVVWWSLSRIDNLLFT